jgi:hypothetical protein
VVRVPEETLKIRYLRGNIMRTSDFECRFRLSNGIVEATDLDQHLNPGDPLLEALPPPTGRLVQHMAASVQGFRRLCESTATAQ